MRATQESTVIPGLDGVPDLTITRTLEQRQAAAAQLPAAARALLDASRAVNASGTGYQQDLDRVLTDNQALLNTFRDLRTIEEEMLLELQKIAANTNGFAEVGNGRIRVNTTVSGDPLVVATTDGHRAVVERLDRVIERVAAVEAATRRGFSDQLVHLT